MNRLLWLVLLMAGLIASQANANEGPLKSQLTALHVVVSDDGKEKLEPTSKAAPGDILQYQINYENVGKSALSGIIVAGPIPDGTHYLTGSAKTTVDSALEVSIDKGKTWSAPPLYRQVKAKDGSMKKEEIPANEYTAIRWKLNASMSSGQKYSFTYRIKVNEK